jgi:glycosyltransferase involved in cell wall biosynthesis
MVVLAGGCVTSSQTVGVVVIGRNEGERLVRSLDSVVDGLRPVVYVDSGSTDGSCEAARARGVTVVNLDLSLPFTAARARNAGFEQLLKAFPSVEFVQFVDGDCEVAAGWLEQAQQVLSTSPAIVVVCGRRREQFPDVSRYNRLCDLEWDTPIGEATACGGDAMIRVTALQQVNGYNPMLIAGEEPELCVRLRKNGGKILRIDVEMTLHDAQITHLGQWWQRSTRAGHAYAEGAWLHGAPPERHWVRESRRIWLWGVLLPLLAFGGTWFTHGWSLLLLAGYPLMLYRIYRYRRSLQADHAMLYATFCVLGKFPEAQGQLHFYINKLLRRRSRLIEYRAAADKPIAQLR